jgi:hypothetical protein
VDFPPGTNRWNFIPVSGKSIQLHHASTGDLRQYWQSQNDPTREICNRRPPLSVRHHFGLFIKHKVWLTFWKADIPHQARTAWWRLLHDKIPHKVLLHRRQPGVHKTATCQICKGEDEDAFHLFVNCPEKWKVWHKALQELLPSLEIDTPTKAWQPLLLSDSKSICKPAGKQILPAIGLILVSYGNTTGKAVSRTRDGSQMPVSGPYGGIDGDGQCSFNLKKSLKRTKTCS